MSKTNRRILSFGMAIALVLALFAGIRIPAGAAAPGLSLPEKLATPENVTWSPGNTFTKDEAFFACCENLFEDYDDNYFVKVTLYYQDGSVEISNTQRIGTIRDNNQPGIQVFRAGSTFQDGKFYFVLQIVANPNNPEDLCSEAVRSPWLVVEKSPSGSGEGDKDPGSKEDSGSESPVETQAASSASDNRLLTERTMTRLVKNAVEQAGTGDAVVRLTNVGAIDRRLLQSAQKAAGSKALTFHFDQVKNKTVESRLFIRPALLGSKQEGRLSTRLVLNKPAIQKLFEKHFSNAIQSVAFAQKGGFDGPVGIAAKLDLSGWKAEDIRLYRYQAAENSYQLLTDAKPFIDKNGYLHATGLEGVETLIVSNGPLARR